MALAEEHRALVGPVGLAGGELVVVARVVVAFEGEGGPGRHGHGTDEPDVSVARERPHSERVDRPERVPAGWAAESAGHRPGFDGEPLVLGLGGVGRDRVGEVPVAVVRRELRPVLVDNVGVRRNPGVDGSTELVEGGLDPVERPIGGQARSPSS